MDAADIVGLVLLAVLWLGPLVVCGLKGRWWSLAIGTPFHLVAWIGVCRYAKPGSWWYRHQYDEPGQQKVWERHWRKSPRPWPGLESGA